MCKCSGRTKLEDTIFAPIHRINMNWSVSKAE